MNFGVPTSDSQDLMTLGTVDPFGTLKTTMIYGLNRTTQTTAHCSTGTSNGSNSHDEVGSGAVTALSYDPAGQDKMSWTAAAHSTEKLASRLLADDPVGRFASLAWTRNLAEAGLSRLSGPCTQCE